MDDLDSVRKNFDGRNRRSFMSNNMTALDYRKELTACKGQIKLKKKRKKSEFVKKKQAFKKALKRKKLIEEGKFLHPSQMKGKTYINNSNFNAEVNRLKCFGFVKKTPEVCRKYSNGFCPRGENCKYMHEEFPCKFYHLGYKCLAEDKCRFSHAPLNEKSRQILKNSMLQSECKTFHQTDSFTQASSEKKTSPIHRVTADQFYLAKREAALLADTVNTTPESTELPKLNFYVDTYEDDQQGWKQCSERDVNLDSLFIQGGDLQSSEKSSIQDIPYSSLKGKCESFCQLPPVFVKHGRIVDDLTVRKKLSFKVRNFENNLSSSLLPTDKKYPGASKDEKSKSNHKLRQLCPILNLLPHSKPEKVLLKPEEDCKHFLFNNSDVASMFRSLVEENVVNFASNEFTLSFQYFWGKKN